MRVSLTRQDAARLEDDRPDRNGPAALLPAQSARIYSWRTRLLEEARAWMTQAGPEAIKRALDICGAAVLLAAAAPLVVPLVLARRSKRPLLRRTPRAGRWHQSFAEYSFRLPEGRLGRWLAQLKAERTAVLMNVVKGEMSLVGPRPVSPSELHPRDPRHRLRYTVRPGVVCLHWLRRRASIDYGDEWEADAEYVRSRGLLTDLGIVLRVLPALAYGLPKPAGQHIELVGVPIDNLSMSEALAAITARLDGERPAQVSFVNAHCANVAAKDPEYVEALRHSDLVLADGIGMRLAGRWLGRELKQNINGTDLFPRLCTKLAAQQRKVFLLGGRPGVPERVRDWMLRHYPGLVVCGVQHGHFAAGGAAAAAERVAASGAELLLVALGVPGQEKWIHRYLQSSGVKAALGVGGLFDFYSGRVPRAPVWLREMGLEWAYRLVQEPRRMWRRYLVGNARFLVRVAAEGIEAAAGPPAPASRQG